MNIPVRDVDGIDSYLRNLLTMGFQSTEIARGREILREMYHREGVLKILAFTGNLVATGLRGYFMKMIEKGYVDIIVTTGATIDHDVIRSFIDYYIGDFRANDRELNESGINRIGNIYVPTRGYEILEEITNKLFGRGGDYSPSEIAKIYGKYLYENNKRSILSLCYQKNIPIISPGVVDAALGLNMYFISQRNRLIIDPMIDLKSYLNRIAEAKETGALVLGGGISKHHTIGANIIRGGLDYAVYVNTANEWDGSLSGARTDEGVSWGKIKGKHVNIYGEATYVLPILLWDLV
ncbi:MAG: deoxyhypusine synthase [Candidatus Micrarchaeota archaeon]|nr:deoxyhypusine synthase [Candidatus Micrarchaeota archaeon]